MTKTQIIVVVVSAILVFGFLLWANRDKKPPTCPRCGGRVIDEPSYHKTCCEDCGYNVSKY